MYHSNAKECNVYIVSLPNRGFALVLISLSAAIFAFGAFVFFDKGGRERVEGLAIVASIIKNHNGTFSVSSTEGSGTTFTITLPASASVHHVESEYIESGSVAS